VAAPAVGAYRTRLTAAGIDPGPVLYALGGTPVFRDIDDYGSTLPAAPTVPRTASAGPSAARRSVVALTRL
jgi:hypothetical protein